MKCVNDNMGVCFENQDVANGYQRWRRTKTEMGSVALFVKTALLLPSLRSGAITL